MEDMMKQGMGMMGKMMSQGGQGSGNGMGGMMEMCKNMTQSVMKSADMASFASEEIRGLFQDWLSQVEIEVLASVTSNAGQIDIAAIAGQLSISEKSARLYCRCSIPKRCARLRSGTRAGDAKRPNVKGTKHRANKLGRNQYKG